LIVRRQYSYTKIKNKILGFKTQLKKIKARIQEMEKQKQSTQEGEVKANLNMRDSMLEEKLTNNLDLISLENKLDIKPINEEINNLVELDHECKRRAMNLIIFGIKEQEEDMLAIVKY
jgi:hypothetical protein